jgi:hypothetical protein
LPSRKAVARVAVGNSFKESSRPSFCRPSATVQCEGGKEQRAYSDSQTSEMLKLQFPPTFTLSDAIRIRWVFSLFCFSIPNINQASANYHNSKKASCSAIPRIEHCLDRARLWQSVTMESAQPPYSERCRNPNSLGLAWIRSYQAPTNTCAT